MKFSFGKKSGSKKPKPAVAKKSRSGVAFLLILAALAFGGAGGQYAYTYTKTSEYSSQIETDRARIAEVQKSMVALKFYEDRKSKIENNHKIYAAVKSGPGRKEDLGPFVSYGFDQFDMLFVKEAKQPGISLAGSKTEFQRILEAVAQVEAKYPLLQFSRLDMSLPEGTLPLAEEPTYLDCAAELYSPRL
jgi:hypothetical protein